MGFFDLFKRKKKSIFVEGLDVNKEEVLIKRIEQLEKQTKSLRYSNVEKDSAIQKQQTKLRQYEDSDNKIKEEKLVKEDLNAQFEEIKKKRIANVLSLKKFFTAIIKNPKLAKQIKILTAERDAVLGTFGDIGLSEKQGLVLYDQDMNPITSGFDPREIFESVDGLSNDISAKRIPVLLDKNYTYVDKLTTRLIRPVEFEGTTIKKLRTSEIKLYKILAEKDENYARVSKELEVAELLNVELRKKNEELSLALRVQTEEIESKRNDRTQDINEMSNIRKAMNNLSKDLANSQNSSTIKEDKIGMLTKANKKLLSSAEREESQTDLVSKLKDMKQIKETLETDIPKGADK